MPFLIADELHPFMFRSVMTCKIFRYVTYNTALISIFTLFVIAIERHRKICRPLDCQLTLRLARRILIGIVFLTSTVFALPAFVIYGETSIPTGRENITGAACFTDDKFRDSYIPLAYNTTLFTIVFLLGTVMVYCYIKIAHQRLLRAKLTNARRKYNLVESSGNFISEQSEYNLHTSDINGIAQEYREKFSDQTTQTNDSVLYKSKTMNNRSNKVGECYMNGGIKDPLRQTSTFRFSVKYSSPKTKKGNNGVSRDFKVDKSQSVIESRNISHFGLDVLKQQSSIKSYDDLCNTINNWKNINKKENVTNLEVIPKVRSLSGVNCNELLLKSNIKEDECKKNKKLISGLLVSKGSLDKTCITRRHSLPDNLVNYLLSNSFDEKGHTLPRANLDLNIRVCDQKTHLDASENLDPINNTSKNADKMKQENNSRDVNEESGYIDDNSQSTIKHICCKTNVPMGEMTCQNNYSNPRTQNGGKVDKLANKTNQRTRKKIFIRRNKTKSAKFAKLRDTSLITVTKMLFYITLVYFISFIPHLVLMITLMLNKPFLSSLDQVEATVFYIGLRSFLINSVANPFIYNFMDTKFRKECKKLFNWKKSAEQVYSF